MKPLSIVKPGIISGNVITLCGGYFLASKGHIHLWPLLVIIIGMSLVIACGCILNNVIDRDIDRLMERTKNRIMAQGLLPIKKALLYATIVGVLGLLILYWGSNLLTAAIGLFGLIIYAGVYSVCLKRKSTYGTIIGGIAGAVPPVVGYCAVTNRFDLGAVILFFILFLWQMPHFYAIAIFRLKDFEAASIPVLPLKKGIQYTKISMMRYIAAFTIVAILPSVFGYAGVIYFLVALALGATWFYRGYRGFKVDDDRTWARKMFLFSILLITVLSVAMAIPY